MTQNADIIRSRQPLTKRDLEASLINLKNGQTVSKYLPVQGRILWFHGEVSRYKIDTEMLQLDWNAEFEGEKWGKDEAGKAKKFAMKAKGVAVFKAVVTIYSEAGEVMIQVPGHKSEKAVDFPDFMEKAETGSIGRALALAGYGTKFAIELDEGPRIVDSPVERAVASVTPLQPQVSQEMKDKVKEVATKAVAMKLATDYKSFYEWASGELGFRVMGPANLTMENLKDLADRLYQLELQQAAERKAS